MVSTSLSLMGLTVLLIRNILFIANELSQIFVALRISYTLSELIFMFRFILPTLETVAIISFWILFHQMYAIIYIRIYDLVITYQQANVIS